MSVMVIPWLKVTGSAGNVGRLAKNVSRASTSQSVFFVFSVKPESGSMFCKGRFSEVGENKYLYYLPVYLRQTPIRFL